MQSEIPALMRLERKFGPISIFFGLFTISLLVRAALMIFTKSYLYAERDEVVRIAISFARNGVLGNAYGPGSGPTATTPPLYPMLLSLLYRVFGIDAAGTAAQELLSSGFASIQYALLPALAIACGMPRSIGILAGVMGALTPISRWIETKGNFEYALSGMLCAGLALGILRAWQERDFSLRRGVVLGALSGITMLVAPQFAVVLTLLMVYPLLAFREARRAAYWKFVAAQLGLMAAFLAPWVIRNQVVLGVPVWSRSNLGMELNLSNNDKAKPGWQTNFDSGLFAAIHPTLNVEERARLVRMGEMAYNAEKERIGKQWIATHPARFAILTLERAVYFWFPPERRPVQTLALGMVTLLGFIGFGIFARWRDSVAHFFLILWLVFPLPTYVFQQSGRMRYPIQWTTYLFAAYCLSAVLAVALMARQRRSSHTAG